MFGDDDYPMIHAKRGKAVVFNHDKFDNPSLGEREGTSVDVRRLEETFSLIGFDVQVQTNLRKNALLNYISQLAQEDHSDYDCLCVIVLTHGESSDMLYARDKLYKQKKLWKPFTADECKSLAGKPKMFFIQACRGEKMDPGVRLQSIEIDSTPMNCFMLPKTADFLMAYSTLPDYVAWRNTTTGSWFIQALCDVIQNNHRDTDLIKMMTRVAQLVGIKCESTSDNPHMAGYKEIPAFTSTLLKKVYFR